MKPRAALRLASAAELRNPAANRREGWHLREEEFGARDEARVEERLLGPREERQVLGSALLVRQLLLEPANRVTLRSAPRAPRDVALQGAQPSRPERFCGSASWWWVTSERRFVRWLPTYVDPARSLRDGVRYHCGPPPCERR